MPTSRPLAGGSFVRHVERVPMIQSDGPHRLWQGARVPRWQGDRSDMAQGWGGDLTRVFNVNGTEIALVLGPTSTFGWCLATRSAVRIAHVQRLSAMSRPFVQRRGSASPARLHMVAFVGGIVALALGLVGWTVQGGPASIEELVVVLDLTVGGTILCTGALVGRARAAESRRAGQLLVLQFTAKRMSANLSFEEVGRAVVEETRRVIDYHNARVYLLEPPDDLVPVAFVGRVGAYEKVDLEILRTKVGEGLTGWAAKHGAGRSARTTPGGTRAGSRSPAPTTWTSRCSWSRCSTTTGWWA